MNIDDEISMEIISDLKDIDKQYYQFSDENYESTLNVLSQKKYIDYFEKNSKNYNIDNISKIILSMNEKTNFNNKLGKNNNIFNELNMNNNENLNFCNDPNTKLEDKQFCKQNYPFYRINNNSYLLGTVHQNKIETLNINVLKKCLLTDEYFTEYNVENLKNHDFQYIINCRNCNLDEMLLA